ncbi:MAG: hypothetical protein ACRCU2_16295, partial [Planktothrix sp.]
MLKQILVDHLLICILAVRPFLKGKGAETIAAGVFYKATRVRPFLKGKGAETLHHPADGTTRFHVRPFL